MTALRSDDARPVVDADVDADVDVVIVSYNAAAYLRACLDSVAAACAEPDERIGDVVVVDNDSRDHSAAVVAAHAGVRWLASGANRGFGSGANRGVAATSAPYVLLLNPDAELVPGAVAALRRAMTAPRSDGTRVAIVGPRVTNADGATYPSARAFPRLGDALGHAFVGLVRPDNRWSRRYLEPERPEWVSGTAMLVRRDAFEQVGGFDERYFMYVEDVDLCWRLGRAGWGVTVAPDAEVRHAIGGSSEMMPYRMIVAHHRSLWRFANRSTRGVRRAALPLIAVGLVARCAAASLVRAVRRRPPAAR